MILLSYSLRRWSIKLISNFVSFKLSIEKKNIKNVRIKNVRSRYTEARFQHESLSRVLSYWTANHTQAAVTLAGPRRAPRAPTPHPLSPPPPPPPCGGRLRVFIVIFSCHTKRPFSWRVINATDVVRCTAQRSTAQRSAALPLTLPTPHWHSAGPLWHYIHFIDIT